MFLIILIFQGVGLIASINFKRNEIIEQRFENFKKISDEMSPSHLTELQKDISQSNKNLTVEVKLLVPGTDNQIQYTRFREVLRTKQYYILMFVDFCQSMFWVMIMVTIIKC
jgi:hypothetical protein